MSLATWLHRYQSHVVVFGVVVATVALIAGLVAAGSRSAPPSPDGQSASTSRLAADRSANDFGAISMAAGLVSTDFTIRNTTSETLTISKLSTSCMCTSASLQINESTFGPFGMPGHGVIPAINQTLASGATAKVTVTFDPAAHGPSGIGRIVRNVYLDGPSGERLSLTIQATVKP
ncbi:MAG: hypothetical protein A3J59_03920 [Candidatus Buchananbacteria bacterium RIFCSPHIGHO2_02_FULL_56_16]|uniref:DUF1573 domain-containing protein n=1 Tax=Candidatus Buchananbacteria bacterium RIFCSPHIGHO2_02_FULL_56_16 TaxID=1797542 RepID=A0A1G1YJQ1_9BACT|nr:MAG: hypothetical protein A3J59_03920 [Candidatus Buchananbacteria bacterium RIFCSPHIGHO2_02_FULL_56_16]